MIEWLIPQTSTFASDIDNLFLLIVLVVGFWYALTVGMFFWLMIRYRAREGVKAEYITGKEPELKRWITIPHALIILCDVVLVVGAVKVWYDVKQDLPPADAELRVVSQQWAWTFHHEGPDGELGTPDDIVLVDELHIEVGKTYHWHLESLDVLHSFSIPTMRFKQDAIPGRVNTGWFTPTKTGEYDVQCAEMCGIGHGAMGARVFIHTPEDYELWQKIASARLAGR
ncbi:MAG: cytochrome C oxidase subunit II [Myxococcota bacterium]